MTTVACVFVRGHVPFTAEYVTRLAAMVKRWMDRPYQFVCLTDSPESVTNTVQRAQAERFKPLVHNVGLHAARYAAWLVCSTKPALTSLLVSKMLRLVNKNESLKTFLNGVVNIGWHYGG